MVITEHKAPIEEQFEIAEAVQFVTTLPGWEHLTQALDHRKSALHRRLMAATKPRETPADYEILIAEIRGIEQIDRAVTELTKLAEEAQHG